jgi:hypothetical protein
MSRDVATPTLRITGALDPLHNLYIVRQSDALVLELLLQREYCNVLTSRQVGKSSLVNRTAPLLMNDGHKVVVIDVAGNLGTPANAADWYLAFVGEVVRQVRSRIDARAWWDAATEPTPNQRLLRFFRELATEIAQPITIFVDEIDHTLKFPFTDDFFTAIRAMANARSIDERYRMISFCLVGVATPNELIKNRRTTAYNVGRTIELKDFDPAVDDLSALYAVVSSDPEAGAAIVRAILDWTGGHPYLTARLCSTFVGERKQRSADVTDLIERDFRSLEALRTDVHFQQIMRFLEERAKNGSLALTVYERVLSGRRTPDQATPVYELLKLSGLVKRDESGRLVVRNRLYERIFNLEWVRAIKLLRARKRQRQLGIAGVLSAAVLAIGIAYNAFVVTPARTAYGILRATNEETVAASAFAALAGSAGSGLSRWLPTGYGSAARSAYDAFWERRAARLDERALQRLRAGSIDDACILAAAAAVKRQGPVNEAVMSAYNARGLAGLKITPRPVSTRGAKSVLRYEFSGDGRSILVNWGAEFGPNLLQVVDVATGAPSWTHQSKNPAFFLARGETYAEEVGDETRVINRTTREEKTFSRQGLPSSYLDVTVGYFSAQSERQAVVWDLEDKRKLFDVRTSAAIIAIYLSNGKDKLAVQTSNQLLLWSIGSPAPVVINAANSGPGVPAITFSSDGAYISRFVPAGAQSSARLDVWTVAGRHVLDGSSFRGLEEAGFITSEPLMAVRWTDPNTRKTGGAVFAPSSPPPAVAMFDGRLQGITDDGSAVATVHANSLAIWQRSKDSYRQVVSIPMDNPIDPSEQVKFSPSSQLIAFRDSDKLLRVWLWESAGAVRHDRPGLMPLERWRLWQTQFGLTLNDADDLVPLTFDNATRTPAYSALRGRE